MPYALLAPNFRKIAIEALFPADRATAEGWEHRVSSPSGKPESLWRIAEWFTGDGARYRDIREAGSIPSLETRVGQIVVVPGRWLIEPFRNAVKAAAPAPARTWKPERRRSSSARMRRDATPSIGCRRARPFTARWSCVSPDACMPRT